MKTKLLLCVALLGVGLSSLFAGRDEIDGHSNHLITVGEYVNFLNEVAATSNANDLYEGASKQISYRGRLGDYYYEQTTLQGEAPMLLLSWREAEAYCDWKNSSKRSARKREALNESFYLLSPSSEALEQVDQELKSNLLTFRIISTEAKAYQASGEEAFCSSILDDLLEGVFLIAGVGNAITRQPRADELEESTRSTPDIGQQVAMKEEVAEVMQEETRAANKRARVIQEEINAAHKRAKMSQEETRAIQAEERITMLEAEIKTLRKEKEIAEINIQIEKLRRLAFENKMKADAPLGFVQSAYQQSSDFFSEAVEYLGNAIVAISSENLENSILWREAAMYIKEAAEKCQETVEEWLQKDKKPPMFSLGFVAKSFFMQAKNKKYLAKASEAEGIRKRELAQQWHNVVQQNQQASKYLEKEVEAHTRGKEQEEKIWRRIGNTLLDIAIKLEKVIEAEEAQKPFVAEPWRQAAGLQQQSVQFYKKAMEAYAGGREEEAKNWKNGGHGFYRAAENLGQAIKAEEIEEAERSLIAQAWREMAVLEQQSGEFFKKAAEACVVRKEQESIYWHNAGHGSYGAAEKLGKEIEIKDPRRSPVIKSGSYWNKAGDHVYFAADIEVDIEAKKPAIAKAWREAAELQQQSVKFYQKAAEACAAEKEQEAIYWNNVGKVLCNAAEILGKAIEAEKSRKIWIAQAYREMAALCKQSVKPFEKVAEAHTKGKEQEVISWNKVGRGFYNAAKKLIREVEAEEVGKSVIALAWHKAATLQHQSGKFFEKAAEVYAERKGQKAIYWNNAGYGSYNAAEKLEKAIEAEESRKISIAQVWRNAAALQQRSVEFCKKAAEVSTAEKEEEAIMWNKAGSGFYRAAEKLIKGIKSEEAGEPIAAQVWREAAAAQQHSVEFYKKAAEAYAAGREEEARSWENAGKGFYNTAEQLGEGIEAEESVEVSCGPGLGRCSRKIQTGPSMLKSSNRGLHR